MLEENERLKNSPANEIHYGVIDTVTRNYEVISAVEQSSRWLLAEQPEFILPRVISRHSVQRWGDCAKFSKQLVHCGFVGATSCVAEPLPAISGRLALRSLFWCVARTVFWCWSPQRPGQITETRHLKLRQKFLCADVRLATCCTFANERSCVRFQQGELTALRNETKRNEAVSTLS